MAETEEMLHLCGRVRSYLKDRDYSRCREEISYAMYLYPHLPEPHNLMGLLLEREHDHAGAMRHFRAAYALDPTYLPARENMQEFGNMEHPPRSHYTAADCTT